MAEDLHECRQRQSSAQGSGAELKRRSLVAAGKARDLNGERTQAVQDYQWAIANGSDTTQGEIARKLIKTPYREP